MGRYIQIYRQFGASRGDASDWGLEERILEVVEQHFLPIAQSALYYYAGADARKSHKLQVHMLP